MYDRRLLPSLRLGDARHPFCRRASHSNARAFIHPIIIVAHVFRRSSGEALIVFTCLSA